ncbi:MAG: response regulator [Desulfobacter sp.]|nr:response regulator [Desulfobacter sp.]
MSAFLSRAPIGLCIVRQGIILWANQKFYAMTGYGDGSLEGKAGRILYPTQKAYDRVAAFLNSKMNRLGEAMTETRLSRADTTTFDCRIRTSWMDPDNLDKGTLVTASDITEFNAVQIQSRQAEKMEAIGVLAGGVSHDFNNLLMGIQGHISLMRVNLNRPEKVGGHLRQMGKLVKTGADLTSRLLGFARGGKYQITMLDINQVVSIALNVFQPGQKDIQIQADLADTLFSVDGDHSQLEQVVLNLLVNASQAMVDGGVLTIQTRNLKIGENHGFHFEIAPGPYVEILVKDTGIGMDETIQNKIFDPFFSTKAAGDTKGRGLGLSTVFGIVKNHGGFITVDSQKGEGSAFRVCLPGSGRSAPETETEKDPRFELMPRGSETILLVEDEEEILTLGNAFLEKLGYTPILARNGLEAVEMVRAGHSEIALVVLDLIMPVMDGKEAFFKIREISPEVKVLVSTGFTVDEEVDTLLGKGCHGFLQKPYSMDKFSRTIRDILDRNEC